MSVRRDRRSGWYARPEYPDLGQLPPDATVLADLRAGICPFCGKGPYVVPLIHISKSHGIDRLTVRDLAGLGVNESLCDPTHSAVCSERAKRLYSPENMRNSPGRKKRPTRLLRQAQAAKSQAAKVAMFGEAGQRERIPRVCPVCEKGFDQDPWRVETNPEPCCSLSCAAKRRMTGMSESERRALNGNLAKTHCPQGHPYDDENTYQIERGDRLCRACRRDADRLRRRAAAHAR